MARHLIIPPAQLQQARRSVECSCFFEDAAVAIFQLFVPSLVRLSHHVAPAHCRQCLLMVPRDPSWMQQQQTIKHSTTAGPVLAPQRLWTRSMARHVSTETSQQGSRARRGAATCQQHPQPNDWR